MPSFTHVAAALRSRLLVANTGRRLGASLLSLGGAVLLLVAMNVALHGTPLPSGHDAPSTWHASPPSAQSPGGSVPFSHRSAAVPSDNAAPGAELPMMALGMIAAFLLGVGSTRSLMPHRPERRETPESGGPSQYACAPDAEPDAASLRDAILLSGLALLAGVLVIRGLLAAAGASFLLSAFLTASGTPLLLGGTLALGGLAGAYPILAHALLPPTNGLNGLHAARGTRTIQRPGLQRAFLGVQFALAIALLAVSLVMCSPPASVSEPPTVREAPPLVTDVHDARPVRHA